MAESVLLAVVRGVAGKAADQLVQTVTRMCGLDGDRDTLELHLLAVQRKLASAEQRSGTDHAVKRWMKKLSDVAREADDVLEDFRYEALRRKFQTGESTTPGRVVAGYFTQHSPLRFRYAMSGKLKTVLGKINKLVQDMNMFGLESSVHLDLEGSPPRRQTHSKLDEFTQIFGRDDDKDAVVELLLDQQDQRNVQVLSIFGMGGLGKTTTAKMVYNDQEIQQRFELKMWHCVSDSFDVIALLKSVIQLARNGSCENLPDNIELLRQKLEEAIGRKSFLLVLDDVWNEERTLWEDDLKPLLCSVGGPGSAIIVTCRSKKVASIMSTVTPHELKFLSDEDSWKLFSMKAFSNGAEEQAELVAIGRSIVNKCGGLPLALKTMGGLLSSKEQVRDWKAIEETNIGDNVGGNNGVMSVLKLSYRYLSSEMKRCFAFCALFSKDYEMQKDILIQLWMANGFIEEEKTMDLTQKGEVIFHELVQRSFLQDIKVVVKPTVYYGSKEYETIVCKMHDLMHDLARDVSDECATIEELIEQKASVEDVCHMQISSEVKLEKFSGLFKGKKTSLRTLFAPSKMFQDFNGMPHVTLRALHWQSSSYIHLKAINWKHLRYLDLSRSNNESLPDSICRLYNLQTLRLNDCCLLKQLPEDLVISLRKLIHLYLLGCWRLEKMPQNIGQLNNLHTLTKFVVDTVSGCGIEELRDLRHISNRLELYNLRKIKSVNQAIEAKLQQKQNLNELLFSWGLTTDDNPENDACNEQEVFQCLEPHSKIQILELYGYGGIEMPQWMGDPQMFMCLRKLKIYNCPRCKNIPLVWLSSSLVYLSLCSMDKLMALCDNNLGIEGGSPLIFPKLKYMSLSYLASLERLVENNAGDAVDSFPVLEEVSLMDCPMLDSFPSSPTLKTMSVMRCFSNVEDIPMLPASLELLMISYCNWVALPSNLGDLAKLRLLNVENCFRLEALHGGDDAFPSLCDLTINNCAAIEEFPNGLLQQLPALVYIHLFGCPELERRCREGGEYFDLVSSIPIKNIPQAPQEAEAELESEGRFRTRPREAESIGNKYLKRLVPCCAQPNSYSESDNN